MNCRRVLRLVEDYLDCLLPPRRGARLEAHLGACPSCRRALEETIALRTRLGALPRSFAPERELWSGIRQRLPKRRVRSIPLFRPLRPVPLGAAACVLVLVLLALVTLRPQGRSLLARRPAGIGAEHPAASLRDFQAIEADYRQVREALLSALGSRLDGVDPGLADLVEANLAAIDRSVAEIEKALRKYPGKRELLLLLAAANSRRLDVLAAAQKQLMEL